MRSASASNIIAFGLPFAAIVWCVVGGLWLVPDTYVGMYGNHDGQWAAWNVHAIFEWSRFLDFSPFSPLIGTGSLLLPNLPWLNPGALALALPIPESAQYLVSMLVYFAELGVSLYFLCRALTFSPALSFFATLLYAAVFFIPFNYLSEALSWFSLAPMNAHIATVLNVATIGAVKIEGRLSSRNVLWTALTIAMVFVAVTTAPITVLTFLPIYAALWAAIICSSPLRAGLRFAAVVLAFAALWAIGFFDYVAATAALSGRAQSDTPMFRRGMAYFTMAYWADIFQRLSMCDAYIRSTSVCPNSIPGVLQIAALGGGVLLAAMPGPSLRRWYGAFVAASVVGLTVLWVLSFDGTLGWMHVISIQYFAWALYPLLCAPVLWPAVVAAGFLPRVRTSALPAFGAAVAVLLVWTVRTQILVNQPRANVDSFIGLRLPAINHWPPKEGPIIARLREEIGLVPGRSFRGYAATVLGIGNGGPVRIHTYIDARESIRRRFGNNFQMMDLWAFGIPTFEEYGQWVTKQMFAVDRDLLSEPGDKLDVCPVSGKPDIKPTSPNDRV